MQIGTLFYKEYTFHYRMGLHVNAINVQKKIQASDDFLCHSFITEVIYKVIYVHTPLYPNVATGKMKSGHFMIRLGIHTR